MVVHTQTDKIRTLRRGVMELYISDHPLDCLTCSANGDCELQDMAGAVGLREVRYTAPPVAPLLNHFLRQDAPGVENPQWLPKDDSNPYFTYDPSKCIVCSRCVRACEEVQGTFALTIQGRGFDSRVSAGMAGDSFLSSDCVSCGACVQACPTATLQEKSVIEIGTPERKVVTTCAYCGVGCSFEAEMRGDTVVRMTPWKHGKANRGHSCVKGRFAWGYATHSDRVTQPMIRERTSDPWEVVTWDEAIAFAAGRLRDIQAKHGTKAIGGITSSRCTNEETYLVQKMIRAVFGNNNTDTCARVCHSPTGYGLGRAYGTSAGHPGLRLGRAYRRRHRHRRQPHRRPPRLRLPPQEAAARGRPAHRRGPPAHRPRPLPPHRGRAPPGPAPRHQRRRGHRAGPRHRHRRPP
jgi:formate dehydrogenase major subunit